MRIIPNSPKNDSAQQMIVDCLLNSRKSVGLARDLFLDSATKIAKLSEERKHLLRLLAATARAQGGTLIIPNADYATIRDDSILEETEGSKVGYICLHLRT